MAKPAKEKRTKSSPRHKVVDAPLADLHFDVHNPRFGSSAGRFKNEVDVLDYIADNFELEDVLSSIAVNGFFESEPLIGTDEGRGGIRVAEGNRRLAACLILADDPRAKNQEKRRAPFLRLQEHAGRETVTSLPVAVFDKDEKELLPYLGVRHIAGNKPWDSYAKAAWIAHVLDGGELTLEEITQMTGDRHRTISRMLEGYYFVHQLIDAARFVPSDSMRGGRGSNTEYPFSWVYTALGFNPIRQFLGIGERTDGPSKDPVPRDKLDNAQTFMSLLMGSKSDEREPAVPDSRDIPELAVCVGDNAKMRLLMKGKNVREVKELSRPANERVSTSLLDAIELLGQALTLLAEGSVTSQHLEEMFKISSRLKKLTNKVHEEIGKLRKAGGRMSDVELWINKGAHAKAAINADQVEQRAMEVGAITTDEGVRDDVLADALDDYRKSDEINWEERDAELEEASGQVLNEVNRRRDALGAMYPFELIGGSLHYRGSSTLVYELCLAVSVMPNKQGGEFRMMERAFERLACRAMQVYLGEAQ